MTHQELLEESDQYRHPDFDSDSEILIVRLANALILSREVLQEAFEYIAWNADAPKADALMDKINALLNEDGA